MLPKFQKMDVLVDYRTPGQMINQFSRIERLNVWETEGSAFTKLKDANTNKPVIAWLKAYDHVKYPLAKWPDLKYYLCIK